MSGNVNKIKNNLNKNLTKIPVNAGVFVDKYLAIIYEFLYIRIQRGEFMKKILSVLTVFALIACTLKINTLINFSDLTSSATKNLIADLHISVTSCDEDSINEIKTELEKRNIRANFNKCSSDDLWNDYASFSMPVTLVKESVDSEISDIYFQYVNNNLYLKTSNKLESLLDKSSEFYSDKISISAIEFTLVNDTNNVVKKKPTLAFVDEKPVYEKNVEIAPFNKVVIQLPDVANKLLEISNSEYLIFTVME